MKLKHRYHSSTSLERPFERLPHNWIARSRLGLKPFGPSGRFSTWLARTCRGANHVENRRHHTIHLLWDHQTISQLLGSIQGLSQLPHQIQLSNSQDQQPTPVLKLLRDAHMHPRPEQALAPSLCYRQAVVMEDLSIYLGQWGQQAIKARGCCLLFLSTFSPDFSPIEETFSKLKTFPWRVGTRFHEMLFEAIMAALPTTTTQDTLGRLPPAVPQCHLRRSNHLAQKQEDKWLAFLHITLEELYIRTKAARSIFRAEAIKSYRERQEKAVLPHLAAPPIFPFLWVLLGLLLIAGLLAWSAQIPTYVEGDGIVPEQQPASAARPPAAIALIFLPATLAPKVRAGLPVQLQLGSTGPAVTSRIDQVEPDILSPRALCMRYTLACSALQTPTKPVIVVSVQLGASFPYQTYMGSVVSAQVQVGSRRVLSLFPGLDRWMGDLAYGQT